MAVAYPDEVEDLFSCPICLCSFTDPKLLHCGHTFCCHCVLRHYMGSRGTAGVECPLCRKYTPLGVMGVSALQNDFRLSQVRDAIESLSAQETGKNLDNKSQQTETVSTERSKPYVRVIVKGRNPDCSRLRSKSDVTGTVVWNDNRDDEEGSDARQLAARRPAADVDTTSPGGGVTVAPRQADRKAGRTALTVNDGWDVTCLPVDLVAVSDGTGTVSVHPIADLSEVLVDTRRHRRRLGRPRGIAFDDDYQHLLVACHGDSDIAVLDPDDLTCKTRFPLDRVRAPVGLAVLRDGHLAVTSTAADRHGVSVHDPHGSYIRMWGDRERPEGVGGDCVFEGPNFLAVDSHDRILVTDRSSQGPLRIYSREGRLLLQAEQLHPEMTFSGITVDEQDNILVAYSRQSHAYVSLLSPDGRHINSEMLWAGSGPCDAVRGLTMTAKGMVCVSEKRVVMRPAVNCLDLPMIPRI